MAQNRDTSAAIAANKLKRQRRLADELRSLGWTCVEPETATKPVTSQESENRPS